MLVLETLNGIFRPRIHNSPFPDCPDFILSVSYFLLGVDGALTPAGAGGEIMGGESGRSLAPRASRILVTHNLFPGEAGGIVLA